MTIVLENKTEFTLLLYAIFQKLLMLDFKNKWGNQSCYANVNRGTNAYDT